MASFSFPVNNYRFQPGETPLKGDQAKAYASAMKLKAEAESAQQHAAAPTELFIERPEDFRNFPLADYSAKNTLSTYRREDNGEVRGFTKIDDKLGTQYRLSSGVVAGMVGGMVGGMFSMQGDVFQRYTRKDDGSSQAQTLVIDKTTGLMDYSEWEMPGFQSRPIGG